MVGSVPIERVEVSAYTIPTESPESDGTLAWDETTLVLVDVEAGGKTGTGYTYGDAAIGSLVVNGLAKKVRGIDGLNVSRAWEAMVRSLRNDGAVGIGSMAVSAVDWALWDLKGKLLGVSVADLLGRVRDSIPVYGSGGFTSYSDEQLVRQVTGWTGLGIRHVKMKVAREPPRDRARVSVVRKAIGEQTNLLVDANSGYTRRMALYFTRLFADEFGITWMEEPLPPEDIEGLRLVRDRSPEQVEIAEGEYGYDANYFRRLLQADAVDVIMPDACRCGGLTGFLRIAALCEASEVPMSSHGAPMLHQHPGCALVGMRHIEYFHDHARIEQMLFDGAREPQDGNLGPDRSSPGLGFEFKRRDAERYRRGLS